MLAAVLSLFLIFSVSGIAVANLSSFTRTESQNVVHATQNQYAVESEINRALWMLNAGLEDQVNATRGYVSVFYDSSKECLRTSIDRHDQQYTVEIDLSQNTHFDYDLAASGPITSNGHTLEGTREFGFLPEVDLQYFLDNAIQIHNGSFKVFTSEDVNQDGIHVFTGHLIQLRDIDLQGTIVITGRGISFDGQIHVVADSSSNDPALVVTNDRTNIFFHRNEPSDSFDIQGAVYVAGRIYLQAGEFTGPIIGKRIDVEQDFSFRNWALRRENRWQNGFGNEDDYHWPQRIGRWRSQNLFID